MRTVLLSFALALAFPFVLVAGCNEVDVHVHCKTTAVPTVECDLTEKKGKSDVEVCWDLTVTCNNGTTITPPRSCTQVKAGGAPAKYTIPADKLPNVAQCDGGPKMKLSNGTVNGKAFPIE